MTTKLIQELRALSHSKCVSFHVWNRHAEITIEGGYKLIDLLEEDAPEQLQAAIERIKKL